MSVVAEKEDEEGPRCQEEGNLQESCLFRFGWQSVRVDETTTMATSPSSLGQDSGPCRHSARTSLMWSKNQECQ